MTKKDCMYMPRGCSEFCAAYRDLEYELYDIGSSNYFNTHCTRLFIDNERSLR